MNEIIITGDGSTTVYVPELDEHYHSVHGAVAESRHVFIRHGLEWFGKKQITVFEVGFGTGLNAFLAYRFSAEKGCNIFYQAIEKYPLSVDLANRLNYSECLLATERERTIFNQFHTSGWDLEIKVSSTYSLVKTKGDFTDFDPAQAFHLIFFDAFAPDKQPEMWTTGIFAKAYRHLQPGGALVTYCAKGAVKRGLKKAGFLVETLPGPPGKREMVRAIKT